MIIAETTAGAASAAVSAAGAVAAPMDLLELLIIGAVLGMFGQGTRAVIGLKGMSDDARAQGLSFNDLFEAARLLTSLLIGGLVGLASALVFYKANGAVTPDATTCLAWAAAGYAGTDALEGFISQYLSPGATPAAKAPPAAQKATQLAASDAAKLQFLQAPAAAAASPNPHTIVNTAFVEDGKPSNMPPETLLTDPPIKYTGWPEYVALGERINGQLESIYWISQSTSLSWQTKGTSVGTVINAVQFAIAHPHAPIPANAPVA